MNLADDQFQEHIRNGDYILDWFASNMWDHLTQYYIHENDAEEEVTEAVAAELESYSLPDRIILRPSLITRTYNHSMVLFRNTIQIWIVSCIIGSNSIELRDLPNTEWLRTLPGWNSIH